MKRYEYVTLENRDILQNKHRSTIQLYSYSNYKYIGCIPYKSEDGVDKVDLVFEKEISNNYHSKHEYNEYSEY